MAIEDLWYKNAIIYCLNIERYMDANGDGLGDFEGLSRRLDYLAGLGVTCVWLQPFYASPYKDDGYDVSDYYAVNERFGSFGELVDMMNHAHSLGIRVLVDLVVNHTSNEHRWFQSARRDENSRYRDWYVWSKDRPADYNKGMVFPGVQKTTWSWDEEAKQYYFHRFMDFQPDLNTWNRKVRTEIQRIMGFWLQMGISGFRVDAVPFMIEHKGADVKHDQDYEMLHDMRDFLSWRVRDAILLAEANVPPADSMKYFGEEGDRLQMMLNFPVNQRIYYALATGEVGPLAWALEETAKRPDTAQWVQFLRSHDELDLGRLDEDQREKVFRAFAPEETMRLYGRGIRRRIAPMLGNDRKRLELAFSLLFALPGTPMMQYGDEIGMGEDLSLPDRESARTPMQWTAEPNGGFSRAEKTVTPVVSDETFGYQKVNVAEQRRDPESLLNWTERRIRMRKECPEISWGDFKVIRSNASPVLILRYDWRGTSVVTMHNFSTEPQSVDFKVDSRDGGTLVNIIDPGESRADESGVHHIRLGGYGYRWFRVGAADNALNRESR